MKKLLSLLLLCTVVVTTLILKEQKKEQIVLKFAYGSNSPVVKDAMAKMGKLLEEKTNGEVVVEYYPDSQLGGERELIELVQSGAIDFTKVAGAALESFSKVYSIFGLPYLFDNETHFHKVMQSEDIMRPIYTSTEEVGFRGLTYYDSGQRSFYMKNKQIKSPEDLKGMKIRVMQSETAIRMIQLMGGSPTPMPNGETYTALQQGIIDGAESNEFAITEARHGEVARYYSYDEHTRVPDIVIFGNKVLEKLNDSQIEALYEAAYESTEFQKEKWGESVAQAREQSIKDFGMIYSDVTSKDAFKKLVQPLHEEFKINESISEIYNSIVNMK
ncbi:TRAP transporter substrate-binding protein [Cetobacterium sp.]|uniref:TRAP transporter substrate-binding protein n=1 Tax=Cetobacterium sp. TaxID=2071632 RepID=UPI003F2DE042